MVFCGQCGQQMAPGITRCPRCGAAVENGQSGQNYDVTGSNDQTVESQSFFAPQPQQAARPYSGGSTANFGGHPSQGGPQPIMLRGADQNYGTQNAYDATSMMDAHTNMGGNPATMQPQGNTYAQGGGYPTSQPGLSGMQQPMGRGYPASQSSFANAPQSGGQYSYPGFAQPQGSFTPQGNMAYQQGQSAENSATTSVTSRGRTTALVTILVGMLFILVAMVLFIMQFNHMLG
ncbi:zinc ribbon domain-containing protein [Ktedonobacter racemifer]|uniref:Zinc-ribbon domain-containing protein n=1 Tax=Ktedonobacter racemifer DSM 44963 TaxID=485913 RepID=D6TPL6_KTERA|nr:zinc ribbon domain-containing protein [Ktedonobacter racemifer]EFH85630.1 hypothetical protein Krac_6857 [Ktedonobacter racemifer DSM 44963]